MRRSWLMAYGGAPRPCWYGSNDAVPYNCLHCNSFVSRFGFLYVTSRSPTTTCVPLREVDTSLYYIIYYSDSDSDSD